MRTYKGFTIIELLIVIAVLTVLISVAVPYISNIITEAYHGQVVGKVKEIVTLEYSYRQREGSYGDATQLQTVFPLLDFGIDGVTKTYGGVLLGNKGFCVIAVYNKSQAGNWQVFCYFCSDEYTTANVGDFSLFTRGLFGSTPILGRTQCSVN